MAIQNMTDKADDVELITPPNTIKKKVGTGGIARETIKEAETRMQSKEKHFLPIIEEHMKKITDALKDHQRKPEHTIKDISASINQLKSQGGMFNYQLVSDVSALLLGFLPRAKKIDGDILEILAAYQVTVRTIITRNLRGPKTAEGRALIDELENACDRYYKLHFIKK